LNFLVFVLVFLLIFLFLWRRNALSFVVFVSVFLRIFVVFCGGFLTCPWSSVRSWTSSQLFALSIIVRSECLYQHREGSEFQFGNRKVGHLSVACSLGYCSKRLLILTRGKIRNSEIGRLDIFSVALCERI